jgi:hypothetical protein
MCFCQALRLRMHSFLIIDLLIIEIVPRRMNTRYLFEKLEK